MDPFLLMTLTVTFNNGDLTLTHQHHLTDRIPFWYNLPGRLEAIGTECMDAFGHCPLPL
jgi:hypothetical protein